MACVLGPSRGSCTASILPNLLGFGGIHYTILSYNFNLKLAGVQPKLTVMVKKDHPINKFGLTISVQIIH